MDGLFDNLDLPSANSKAKTFRIQDELLVEEEQEKQQQKQNMLRFLGGDNDDDDEDKENEPNGFSFDFTKSVLFNKDLTATPNEDEDSDNDNDSDKETHKTKSTPLSYIEPEEGDLSDEALLKKYPYVRATTGESNYYDSDEAIILKLG
ncbi:unnamed protein product [Ambrosiozyma monospora]|uniref:Unnamed protein product n=1 Tax=Ambrosiozyma monospora TaxID=43982 RepID=A0ACB5T6H1_AMBMO|nr:unnamed protein product [Ambrosiozyma monospora]